MPTTTPAKPAKTPAKAAKNAAPAARPEPAIELQQRAPEWALAIRAQSTVAAIPSLMAEMLPEAFRAAEVLGCRPIMPYARYFAFEMPDIDFEAGCLVDGPVSEGEGRVQAVQLPGGEVAVACHVGPYERLSETYEAVERWLAEHGHTGHGPMWEVYLDDPDTTSPEALRTEIVVPLD